VLLKEPWLEPKAGCKWVKWTLNDGQVLDGKLEARKPRPTQTPHVPHLRLLTGPSLAPSAVVGQWQLPRPVPPAAPGPAGSCPQRMPSNSSPPCTFHCLSTPADGKTDDVVQAFSHYTLRFGREQLGYEMMVLDVQVSYWLTANGDCAAFKRPCQHCSQASLPAALTCWTSLPFTFSSQVAGAAQCRCGLAGLWPHLPFPGSPLHPSDGCRVC